MPARASVGPPAKKTTTRKAAAKKAPAKKAAAKRAPAKKATPKKPARFITMGFSAISWIEHYLVHGPGDIQGEPIDLDDELAGFIVKAYELNERGARKVRRAFLSRSKGRNKSGLAAMIACYEALGPCRFDHFAERGEISPWGYEYEEGEPVGAPLKYVEVLCVATEEDQAGNTYDGIFYMLHEDTASEELLEDYGKLDVGLTRINLPNRRGFIEPETGANESKDGGKSTFIVADETHLWKPPAKGVHRLGKMHQTMARNLQKRKLASGWMLETSTMYAAGENSVAEKTHEYAKGIAEGRIRGSLLFDHRQGGEHHDLNKRTGRMACLKEAYGPAAAWMDLASIADTWDDPQVSEAEWRRYWANQPVPLEEPTPSALIGWRARITDKINPAEDLIPDAIGIAMPLDRSCVSIGTAGRVDGILTIGRTEKRPGVEWAIERIFEIQQKYQLVVAIDEKGPAAPLISKLEDRGVSVTKTSLEDYVFACSAMVDHLYAGSCWILPHPDVEAAFDGARWRNVGDGRQVIGRNKSEGDVSMCEAMVLAGWAVDNVPVGFNIW